MTRRELAHYFKDHLVPHRLYHLKGAHNKRICLEQAADGWNVYFADRKDKVGLLHFVNESDACMAMRDQINQVMRVLYGIEFSSYGA